MADAKGGFLASTSLMQIFAHFDLVWAYWEMPLADGSSREYKSFHTPFSVFKPTKVLHVATKAVSFFQSAMENLSREVEVLIWLDGLMGFASSIEGILPFIRKVLAVLMTSRINPNPTKFSLAAQSAQFCGSVISANGVKFNPQGHDALVSLPVPRTVCDLTQFLHGANSIRAAV